MSLYLLFPRSYDSLRASLRTVARLYGVCGRTCAVTKVQELFYGTGTKVVELGLFQMQRLHEVKGAVLVGVNHHAVNDQLLFRREKTKQAFQTGNVVHRQFQGFHQATVLFLKSMDFRWIHRVGAT